jgi:hypothetical protein
MMPEFIAGANSTRTGPVRIRLFPERTQVRNTVFRIVLTVYLLASLTGIFRSSASAAPIEFLVKLLVPFGIFALYRAYRPPVHAEVLLGIYFVLLLYLTIIGLSSESPQLVLLNTAKYAYGILFLAALLCTLRPTHLLISVLPVFPYLGAALAVQTIVVFCAVQTGHPPPSEIIVYARYKDLHVLSYGWLGYGSAMMAAGTAQQVYRAQSFFMEPTRLASFLEPCIILGFGLFKLTGRKVMLVCALLASASLVLTFSMTAYIVMFAMGVYYWLATKQRNMGTAEPIVWALGIAVITLATVYYLRSAFSFYVSSSSAMSMAFGHSNEELSLRLGFIRETIRLAQDYPLGIGLIGAEDSAILPNYEGAGDVIAPMHWLKIAGLPGIILQLSIIAGILQFVVSLIRRRGIEQYIGLALVAVIVHHCVAGDWFDAEFFFLLALVLVAHERVYPLPVSENVC